MSDFDGLNSIRRVKQYVMRTEGELTPKDEYRSLLAENAKLQEQDARLFDKTLELGTENAKMRELVYIMVYCMQHERGCDGCALNGGSDAITEHVGCDGLRELMRELGIMGIEVD